MTPYIVHHSDCLAMLRDMADASIDSVVTDPPYDLTAVSRGGSPRNNDPETPFGRTKLGGDRGFMGKTWDGTGIAFRVDLWREVLRVLKPGGHVLAFGGTRTYHRMACAIEDAGFEIRDSLHWITGQGFPKSLNVGDGRGTALKPAHEPLVLARKPLSGTVAENVTEHGTGALNINACRVAGAKPDTTRGAGGQHGSLHPIAAQGRIEDDGMGRWPPNILLTHSPDCREVGTREVTNDGHHPKARGAGGVSTSGHGGQDGLAERKSGTETVAAFECVEGCPVAEMDASREPSGSSGTEVQGEAHPNGIYGSRMKRGGPIGFGDFGGPSRFFPVFKYCEKASTADRNFGLDDFPVLSGAEATDSEDGQARLDSPRTGAGRGGGSRNPHPTVKPIDLMRWLCRLITPPGGLILDPFTGSGSTGVGAVLEGFRFVGSEQDAQYHAVATARITKAASLHLAPGRTVKVRAKPVELGQVALFGTK